MRLLPSYRRRAEAGEGPSSEGLQGRHRRQRSAEQRRNPDGLSQGVRVQERGVCGPGQLLVAGVTGVAGDAAAPGPPPPAL